MLKTRSAAAAPSRTTSWTWFNQNRHEGRRICVGNRSSRWPGRRRGGRRRGQRLLPCPEPLADHGRTRTGTSGTNHRKTLLRTGRKHVVQKASCEVCCGFASSELFCVGLIRLQFMNSISILSHTPHYTVFTIINLPERTHFHFVL